MRFFLYETNRGNAAAYPIVKECFLDATSVHPSGSIMILKRSCPWKSHVYKIEKELNQAGKLLYVIYEDESSKTFRIQAVGVEGTQFDSRKALKPEWRGLRDEELAKVTGCSDAVFVHHTGFIGGAKSLESCVKMAIESGAL